MTKAQAAQYDKIKKILSAHNFTVWKPPASEQVTDWSSGEPLPMWNRCDGDYMEVVWVSVEKKLVGIRVYGLFSAMEGYNSISFKDFIKQFKEVLGG